MKHLCVLGCLLTEEGIKIKKEMLSWLNTEYEVKCVEQEPPGKLFEYPAIKATSELSIETNMPVLYVHTKGAANKIPGYYNRMMNPKFNIPSEARPEDCQKVIRNLWKNEFTGERLNEYLKEVNENKPIVCCPYTGIEKITWWNGWIINPLAAKILNKELKISSFRWYYERIFMDIKEITVKGLRRNDLICKTFDNDKNMWDDTWSFFNK